MNRFFPLLLLVLICFAGKPALQAQPKETLVSRDIVTTAEAFIDLMVKEDFLRATESFDSTMRDAMPPETLKDTWKSIIAQVGNFEKRAGTRREKWQQYEFVFVTCEFENLTLDAKVVFDRVGRIAGLWFLPSESVSDYKTPDYAKTGSFSEKEIVVGAGDWALPGTLTLPTGDGPFPAVVLVHGSGPQDRDQTTGPNKPFRDLAWGLASRGIAVVRYEKRTKEHTAKFAAQQERFTIKQETVKDALIAVSKLRQTERIDERRIFVLGHSLGGMMVPRMGRADPDIAGFIVLAGPARPLEDCILEQTNYIYSFDGTISESEKFMLGRLEEQVAKVKDPALSEATPPTKLPLGLHARYWLDLRGYNPAEKATELKQPMLILQGERDYQTTMEDFFIWKEKLSSRKNVEFKSYSKLNHLFMEGEGKSGSSEYQIAGHVAQIVIEDIANWIKKH